jgi:hypothetical protein
MTSLSTFRGYNQGELSITTSREAVRLPDDAVKQVLATNKAP